MSEPTHEVYQAVGSNVRAVVSAATELAIALAHRRAEAARRAQAASEAAAREYAARLRAEHAAAMPVMRQVWSQEWWRQATPEQIGAAWQTTAAWAGVGDPYAQAALQRMREQGWARYGVEFGQVPVREDLAELLAEPERQEPGTQPQASSERPREQAETAATLDRRARILVGQEVVPPEELLSVLLAERQRLSEEIQRDDSAREQLSRVNLRIRAVEAQMRGEDATLVMQAAALRTELDDEWWQTAGPEEIAGVWEHVAGWSDGEAKRASMALLRANIVRIHGVDPARMSSAQEVQAAIEASLSARAEASRLREQGQAEVAAAQRADDRAAAGGISSAGVAAEQQHAVEQRDAAAHDLAAAAAWESLADQEAAQAAAVAALGFPHPPSQRLAVGRTRVPSTRPPGPGRRIGAELGR